MKEQPEEQQELVVAEVEFELDAEGEEALNAHLNEQH